MYNEHVRKARHCQLLGRRGLRFALVAREWVGEQLGRSVLLKALLEPYDATTPGAIPTWPPTTQAAATLASSTTLSTPARTSAARPTAAALGTSRVAVPARPLLAWGRLLETLSAKIVVAALAAPATSCGGCDFNIVYLLLEVVVSISFQ